MEIQAKLLFIAENRDLFAQMQEEVEKDLPLFYQKYCRIRINNVQCYGMTAKVSDMVNDPFDDDGYFPWKKLLQKYGNMLKDTGSIIIQFFSPDYPDWSAYAATTKSAQTEIGTFDYPDTSTFEVPSDYSHYKAYVQMFDALYLMAFGEEADISPKIAFEIEYSLDSVLEAKGKVLTAKERKEAKKEFEASFLDKYKDAHAELLVPIRDNLFCIGNLLKIQIDGFYINGIIQDKIIKRGGGVLDKDQSWADYIVYVHDKMDYDKSCSFAKRHGIEMIELNDLLCSIANAPELSKYERSRQLSSDSFSEKKKNGKQEREAAEELEKKCLRQEKLRLEQEEAEKRKLELRRQRQAKALALHEARERERLEREQLKRQEAERRRLEAEARERERRTTEVTARERKIKEDVLYHPGEEPTNIRRRIDILFPKLDATYPDRAISGLNKDHKKWGETVTELYRALGYPDSRAFLEAYGYTVADNRGGRPSTVDPAVVIKTLCERYPQGAGNINVATLKADNPDLPLKSLENNAAAYFGCTFGYYLKQIGVIGSGEVRVPEVTYKAPVINVEGVTEETLLAAAERRRAVEEAWKTYDAKVEKAKSESTEEPVVKLKAKPENIMAPNSTDSVPKPEDESAQVLSKPETENEEIDLELETENEAFEPAAILTIPEGTKKIDAQAYVGRTDFDAVEIPESVKTIGKGAFQGCTELRRVKLPGGLRTIPNDCFADCVNLREVITGDFLQEIKLRAFARCVSLKKLRIPRGCWSISPAAFEGCVHSKTTLQVTKGSFAAEYARKQGFVVSEE